MLVVHVDHLYKLLLKYKGKNVDVERSEAKK